MKSATAFQVHLTILVPSIAFGLVRSPAWIHNPNRGFLSVIAHRISQSCPSARGVLLLISAMTPAEPRTHARARALLPSGAVRLLDRHVDVLER